MIRVVLDTNIVVSALLKGGGLPEAVLNLALDRTIQLCLSEPVLAEYEEVLVRPRLDIHPEKVRIALAGIREASIPVNPAMPVHVTLDPDDNIFLECAHAAQAHYLYNWQPEAFPRNMGRNPDCEAPAIPGRHRRKPCPLVTFRRKSNFL